MGIFTTGHWAGPCLTAVGVRMDGLNCSIWCDGEVIIAGVDLWDDVHRDDQGQGNTVHSRSWVDIDGMPLCA